MNTIKCPHCKEEIELTQAIAAPMLAQAKKDYESLLSIEKIAVSAAAREEGERSAKAEMIEKLKEASEGEARAKAENKALEATLWARALEQIEEAKREAKAGAAEKLLQEQAATRAAQAASRGLENSLKQTDEAVAELRTKLVTAQAAQAEAIRKERALEEQKREIDLTIETRVTEGLAQVRTKAQKDAEALLGLKVNEKQNVIDDLTRQLDLARAKATQGDQRLQGEVQELQLEALLREHFPGDTVEPVGKGVNGGDALLRVAGAPGTVAGSILFESKRTKTWDTKWLPKLREDMRTAKADIAVIVSTTLPKGVETFALVEGVWVTGMSTAIPLTTALRAVLQEAHSARVSGEGLATKAEIMYRYLTGPNFKARLQATVEAFNTLQDGLRKEKAAIQRQWALREATHDKAIAALVGLHGDLGGIAGASLPELEGADMMALGPVTT